MARSTKSNGRRRAADWAKIVRAWKRSGESAAVFAESVDVSPRTLVWWRWKLASSNAQTTGTRRRRRTSQRRRTKERRAPSAPRFVPVDVQPDEEPGVAWEIHNTRGDTLRVRSRIAPDDLSCVLAAIFSDGSSRS